MGRPALRRDALRCGYVTRAALAEVARLDARRVRLLAALAITHHESRWSDHQRDLLRGCELVLGRPCRWDRVQVEAEALRAAEESPRG